MMTGEDYVIIHGPLAGHRAVDVRVGSIQRSPTLGRLRRFADEVARQLDVAKELLPELANQHRLPFVHQRRFRCGSARKGRR